jgi:hypothetical protein
LQLSEQQVGQVFSQRPHLRLLQSRNQRQRQRQSRNLHQRPHQLCNLQPRVLRLQLALRFRRVFQTSCFRQLCVALFLNMALMSTLWLALVQVVVLPVKMF